MGRELLGGNGVVSDFLVAKQFCDMEVGCVSHACQLHQIVVSMQVQHQMHS